MWSFLQAIALFNLTMNGQEWSEHDNRRNSVEDYRRCGVLRHGGRMSPQITVGGRRVVGFKKAQSWRRVPAPWGSSMPRANPVGSAMDRYSLRSGWVVVAGPDIVSRFRPTIHSSSLDLVKWLCSNHVQLVTAGGRPSRSTSHLRHRTWRPVAWEIGNIVDVGGEQRRQLVLSHRAGRAHAEWSAMAWELRHSFREKSRPMIAALEYHA